MKKYKSIIIALLVSSVLIGILIAVIENRSPRQPFSTPSHLQEEMTAPHTIEEQEINNQPIVNNMNPIVNFSTTYGDIKIEMFSDLMPITTGNFIKLAEEGYYTGTKFHRIIDGFMIQGGDSNSKGNDVRTYGTGGPGYTIQDEFVEGELLTNTRGTLSMANTGQPNSGGSQFFINLVDNSNLDFNKEPLSSKHPVFGRIIEGMDIVDIIAKVETGAADVPVVPVIVESVTVEAEGDSKGSVAPEISL